MPRVTSPVWEGPENKTHQSRKQENSQDVMRRQHFTRTDHPLGYRWPQFAWLHLLHVMCKPASNTNPHDDHHRQRHTCVDKELDGASAHIVQWTENFCGR